MVHINAAMAGLVGAYMIGKRVGYGKESMAPHSLTMTMIGASLLWFGWFGFNAGSALEANGTRGAGLRQYLAGHGCRGAVLDGRRMADQGQALDARCRFRRGGRPGGDHPGLRLRRRRAAPWSSACWPASICLWGVNGLKKLLGADDSLDVFGVHGVGGILGAILTGVFAAPSLGGTGVYDYVANKVGDYDMTAQVIIQATGVGTVIVWSGVVAFVAYKLVDMVIGLRVPEDEEREGLDITSHGESAYHY